MMGLTPRAVAEGRMIEYGSHHELMAKGGEYARMFELQAQYYQDGQEAEA
jgi:hypothetical protein